MMASSTAPQDHHLVQQQSSAASPPAAKPRPRSIHTHPRSPERGAPIHRKPVPTARPVSFHCSTGAQPLAALSNPAAGPSPRRDLFPSTTTATTKGPPPPLQIRAVQPRDDDAAADEPYLFLNQQHQPDPYPYLHQDPYSHRQPGQGWDNYQLSSDTHLHPSEPEPEALSPTNDMPNLIQKALPAEPSGPPPPPPKQPPSSANGPNALPARKDSLPVNLASQQHDAAAASPVDPRQPRRLQPRHVSPSPEPPRGRSVGAQSHANNTLAKPRVASASDRRTRDASPLPPAATPKHSSRPPSTHSSDGTHSPGRGRIRKSWLPGGRSRNVSADTKGSLAKSQAWIFTADGQNPTADYNPSFLHNAEKVPELWNESGDVLVHLFPKSSGRGPSFKVTGILFAHSAVFDEMLQAEASTSPVSSRGRTSSFSGRNSLTADDARRSVMSSPSPPPTGEASGELRLYVADSRTVSSSDRDAPPSPERLMDIRNLVAFLTGQPLVGTPAHPTAFKVLLRIAHLLREFEFRSRDGQSFGTAVDLSFSFYADQMQLGDVRESREKTIEALMLGEQMRSWEMYNEAFTHAVGKYDAVLDLKSPLFAQLSLSTAQRLEREHLDLLNRQHNVNNRLESFDFPAVFAGVASSTSNPDFKGVRFKAWKAGFSSMRSFVLKHYKSEFGSWPPKARSKKNPFSESGLNRQVLRQLYSDLCALYDLLVDRSALSTRIVEQEETPDARDPNLVALRKVLSEFDNSSPPVLPPIPFDVPTLPSMLSVLATYNELSLKEQARFDKKLQLNELLLVMQMSHDFDTGSMRLPFLSAYKDFELKEARGKSAHDLVDQRIGVWIFLYVVIQSLPILAVDAPGLRFTEGVEYFLCQAPQGTPPWMEDATEVRKRWFEAPNGSKVQLAADTVMFSVEAVYGRSHCWIAAKNWEAALRGGTAAGGVAGPNGGGSVGGGPGASPSGRSPARRSERTSSLAPQLPPLLSPLEPPRSVFAGMDPHGASSPMGTGTPASATSSTGLGTPITLRPRNQSPASQRSASAGWRSSIVGLEPVDPPFETNRAGTFPYQPSSGAADAADLEPPSAPYQRGHVPRSHSAGNLKVLVGGGGGGGGASSSPKTGTPGPRGGHGRTGSGALASGGATGMSFDDILKGMDDQKVKKKKSWLPGS